MRFAYCALRDLILRPNATHWFHGTLSLLRLPFDGGGGFLEERAPSIRHGLDLRENLLFLLRRKIGSGVGKPSEVAARTVCSNCSIRRVAKSSSRSSKIHPDTTMAAQTITVLIKKRPIGPRPDSALSDVGS